MPDRNDPAGAPESGPGLEQARTLGLERTAIRTREDAVTRAGWRLSVASRDGEGAITLVEVRPSEAVYRGEGVFLGWPQGRLAAAYEALVPGDDDPPLETLQLG
jgi:hypothetical protein